MIITTRAPENWKDLQNQVAKILSECGFTVEVEKVLETARGKVEIDVYAEEIVKRRVYSIVCECKFWKSKIPQAVIHGFRTVVADLGCNVGYVITSSEYQSGSISASEYTNVELLTWESFQNKFFESWYETYFSPQIAEELDPLLTYVEPILPRWFPQMSDEDQKSFLALRARYEIFGWMIMSFTPYMAMLKEHSIPTLLIGESLKDKEDIVDKIPLEILDETGYQEFFEKCCEFGRKAISEFRYFRDKAK